VITVQLNDFTDKRATFINTQAKKINDRRLMIEVFTIIIILCVTRAYGRDFTNIAVEMQKYKLRITFS